MDAYKTYNVVIYDDNFSSITKTVAITASSRAELRIKALRELVRSEKNSYIRGGKFVAYLGAVLDNRGYVEKDIGKITYIEGKKITYYDSAKHTFYWMNPETGHITPKTRKDNSLALFPRI